MAKIWNRVEVENLLKRQKAWDLHPYTCACHSEVMIPTEEGWKCPIFNRVVQTWAYGEDLRGEMLSKKQIYF